MPSPFAHAVGGYIIYRFAKSRIPGEPVWLSRFPYQAILLVGYSLLPDFDSLPGVLFGNLYKYHNNITHSLFAGLIAVFPISILVSKIFKLPWKAWLIPSIAAYELHVIMDMFTGGRGVMLFWPFITERISSPIRLFVGLQWGNGLFSVWHIWTLLTEAVFFFLVFLLIRIIRTYLNKGSALRHVPEQTRME